MAGMIEDELKAENERLLAENKELVSMWWETKTAGKKMTDYDQEIIAQLRNENTRLQETIAKLEREIEWFDAENERLRNERLRAALAATKSK